jgi:hypothetical protein
VRSFAGLKGVSSPSESPVMELAGLKVLRPDKPPACTDQHNLRGLRCVLVSGCPPQDFFGLMEEMRV